MQRRALRAAASAVLAMAIGCHGGGETPDAPEPCWTVEDTTPEGLVELGTGTQFTTLPASMELMYGVQGGMQMIVNSRMQGLDPGNPIDFLDPKNPKTRFSGVLWDGTRIARRCAQRSGYKAKLDGWYELAAPAYIEFLPIELGVKAFDTDMMLIVEVIDAQGHYARNEATVTVKRPAGFP